jgi:hypothetical protein
VKIIYLLASLHDNKLILLVPSDVGIHLKKSNITVGKVNRSKFQGRGVCFTNEESSCAWVAWVWYIHTIFALQYMRKIT